MDNPDQSDAENAYLLRLKISDMAVATSGSYQRYYTVNGKEYHHIIDPQTLYPQERYVSVTVIANNAGIADALSTALFNMTQEKGASLVNAMTGVEAMWVFADGKIRYSQGFEAYVVQ